MGKKRKKIWKSIPLCIFWTVCKERNILTFRGGVLDIQKLKNSIPPACFVAYRLCFNTICFTYQKKKNH